MFLVNIAKVSICLELFMDHIARFELLASQVYMNSKGAMRSDRVARRVKVILMLHRIYSDTVEFHLNRRNRPRLVSVEHHVL